MDIPALKVGEVKQLLVKVGDKIAEGAPILRLLASAGDTDPVPSPVPDDSNSEKSGMTDGSGTKSPPKPNRFGLPMSIVAALLIVGLFWWLWPEPGRLALDIEPSDARVILPDIESGYRSGMALLAEEYQVIVRQAGYEEFTGTVRIESGERTTQSIVLRRAPVVERAVGDVFRDTLKDGGEGPAMVVLPTGSFRMGSPSGEVVVTTMKGRYAR